MLDCPKCSVLAYDGSACSACGFKVGGSKKATVVQDPMHLVCEHIYQEQRCAELGSLSENIRGGGPWYCYKHFPVFRTRYADKIAEPTKGFQHLKDIIKSCPIA